MSQNPHVLLVHGAWVGGWEFAPIVPALQALGWTVETLELPSTGSTGPLAADAAALGDRLDHAEAPVLLVGHSYGGMPVTEAGDHPSVVGIVYVAAFALDAGESVRGSVGGEFPPEWHVAGGQVTLGATREERIAMVSADFPPGTPPEAGEQLADMFRPQSLASLTDTVTKVAWRTKPSWYLLTEKDVLVPPAFQQALAERAGSEIIRLATGHAPFQEDPQGFVDALSRVAASALV